MVVSLQIPPRWPSGKATGSRATDLGSIHVFAVDLVSRSNHINNLKGSSPVTTLPDAWRYRVSAGTAWPGVSIR